MDVFRYCLSRCLEHAPLIFLSQLKVCLQEYTFGQSFLVELQLPHVKDFEGQSSKMLKCPNSRTSKEVISSSTPLSHLHLHWLDTYAATGVCLILLFSNHDRLFRCSCRNFES